MTGRRNRRTTRRRIRTSHLALSDLLSEAVAGILQRPARSGLTTLGTVLGVGAFIAVLGLTGTATSQIDGRFNQLTATEVTVEDTGGEDADRVPLAFPEDADARIQRLPGVTSGGFHWNVRLSADQPIASAPGGNAGSTDRQASLVAASPGLLKATGPTLAQGRLFDSFHSRSGERVAVLGASVASRLGISTVATQPAVFVGDTGFTVIGIIDDLERKPELLTAVIIPDGAARRLFGPPTDQRAKMLISTELGAAQQIADQAAVALRPDHPEYFRTVAPPNPKQLRSAVSADLSQLFLLLAAVCLVIGAVGIANTTLVAVMERTGEIGLRRALGARGRHITLQFLSESAALGLLGGIVGTSVGTTTVVVVSAVQKWTPVIDTSTLAAAPALGLATGLLAGLYPAWRASRIPPVEALRR